MQLGDITKGQIDSEVVEENKHEKPFIDLEDLVPLSLSIQVVKKFLNSFFNLSDDEIEKHINKTEIEKLKTDGDSYYSVIRQLINKIDSPNKFDIDKVPFAKTLVEMLPELTERSKKDNEIQKGLKEFTANIRTLLRILKVKQTRAEEISKEKNQRKKVQEKVDIFLSDYKNAGEVQRNVVSQLLNNIENDLEGSPKERAYIIQTIAEITDWQRLNDDPIEKVPDFDKLLADLDRLKEARNQIRIENTTLFS